MTITITGTVSPPDIATASVYPGAQKPQPTSGPAAHTSISAASVGLGALGGTLKAGHAAVSSMTTTQAQSSQVRAVTGVLQQLQQLLRQASDPTVLGATRRAIEVNITGLQGELGQLTDQSTAARSVPGVANTQAEIADLQLPGSGANPPAQVAGVDVSGATGKLPADSAKAATSSLKVIDQTMEQLHQKQLANEKALEAHFSKSSSADTARESIFQHTAPPADAAAAAVAQIQASPGQAVAAQGGISPDTAQALTN